MLLRCMLSGGTSCVVSYNVQPGWSSVPLAAPVAARKLFGEERFHLQKRERKERMREA